MYKVLKEKGHNMNVTVENTDTKVSTIIGRLSLDMLAILEKDGHTFGTADGDIKLSDSWELDVSDGIGVELLRIAMRMKKPVRKQKSPASEQNHQEEIKPKKQPVDVFNLIFGIED